MRKLNAEEYKFFYVDMRVNLHENKVGESKSQEEWQTRCVSLCNEFIKKQYPSAKYVKLCHGVKQPDNKDLKEWNYDCYAWKIDNDLPEFYILIVDSRVIEVYDESLINMYKEGVFMKPSWSNI